MSNESKIPSFKQFLLEDDERHKMIRIRNRWNALLEYLREHIPSAYIDRNLEYMGRHEVDMQVLYGENSEKNAVINFGTKYKNNIDLKAHIVRKENGPWVLDVSAYEGGWEAVTTESYNESDSSGKTTYYAEFVERDMKDGAIMVKLLKTRPDGESSDITKYVTDVKESPMGTPFYFVYINRGDGKHRHGTDRLEYDDNVRFNWYEI